MKKLLLLAICSFMLLGLGQAQYASGNDHPSHSHLIGLDNTESTLNQPRVKVFPNPATNFIELSHIQGVSKIKILNLVGKAMKTYEVAIKGEKYNVSDLPNGLYLVQLIDKYGKIKTTHRLNKR